jgi:spore coat protein Z
MGCYECEKKGHERDHHKHHHENEVSESRNQRNCVAGVVKGIVKAQRHAEEVEEDTCLTGCDRSIDDLLSPREEDRHRRINDTIPFMLFCKDDCKAFFGSGVRRRHHHFKCVESPVFKAKSFVDGSSNCVRLELLLPVRGEHHHGEHGEAHEAHSGHDHCKKDVCDFFKDGVRNFRGTGICITVDLDCFCGISCLDPVRLDRD